MSAPHSSGSHSYPISQPTSRSHTLPPPLRQPPIHQASTSSITTMMSGPTTNQPIISAPPSASNKKSRKRSSFSEHTAVEGIQDLTKVRAYAACRNCRTKKIRCLPGPGGIGVNTTSGTPNEHSTCQQCIQAGLECTYPPTRDRAAYSRQYVQNLEVRVQALEAIQNRIIPLLEAFETKQVLPPPLPSSSSSTSQSIRTKRENDDTRLEISGGQDRTNIAADIPMNAIESEGDGENENEVESQEDDNIQGSDVEVEDGGQMQQDERGNYRYIGSSNTLSLLDSFSHRDREVDISGNPDGLISRSNSFPIKPTTTTNQNSSSNSRQSPAISDHTTRNPNPYFGHVAGSGVVKALPPIHEVSYPPPEEAFKMIDAFFLEVHPCLPIVLEHEFRKEFKELMDARARGAIPTQGPFLAVVFAMFALGERVLVATKAWQREKKKLQDNVDGDEDTIQPGEAEAGVIWYERAQILHFTCFKDVNIHQVQCLTLLAAFQASVNAMPMSWLLAGQALRMAQDLGLHRSTSRLPIPFAEKQLRSRCWWAIYGLERMMSISLGRPLGVDDLDIDVAYPAEIDDEGLERMAQKSTNTQDSTPTSLVSGTEEPFGSTMSGFIALTKLCKIAGKVAHLLYRPANEKSMSDPSWAVSQQNAINKLDRLLRDWLENDVPSKYKDPSDNQAVSLISAILSNSYFAILITLHRNFLPSNPDYPRPKPPPSSQSLARCVEAARSVIHIASQSRTQVPSSHHLAVYCQYLWSSAVILLLCEVQAKDQIVVETVGSYVESCRRTLQSLEPVWPGSRKLKELLNDVASRAKEVATVSKVNNARTNKKRKAADNDKDRNPAGSTMSSSTDKTQMRPPPSRNHSSSASPHRPNFSAKTSTSHQHIPGGYQGTNSSISYSIPSGSNNEKRQRTYETSDTRTLITPASEHTNPASASGLSHSQSKPQLPNPYYNNIQSSYQSNSHTSISNPGILPSVTSDPIHGQTQNQMDIGVYDTFDLGGVSFNPSELLQGFSDPASASSFWNQMTFDSNINTSYNPGSGQIFSGQNTPNSTGPSPSAGTGTGTGGTSIIAQQSQASQFSNTATNTGSGTYTPPTTNSNITPNQNQNQIDPFAEFWSQVTGNSFDWQADPSVPFNI